MEWILLICSAAFLLLAIFLWQRKRRPESRLKDIESRLARLPNQPLTDLEKRKLLRTLFSLIAKHVHDTDQTAVYKAIELLQLAYGQGVVRPDEPVAVTSIVSTLLGQNRPELASAALDTYRGLLRCYNNSQMAAEQLQTAGVMAMKAGHAYVADKAVDILFTMFEKPEKAADPATVTASLGVLRVIGKLAIKRQDHDLFRELVNRLRSFLALEPPPAIEPEALVIMLTLWTHAIVSKRDENSLTLLTDSVQELAEKQLLSKSVVKGLLREWQDLTGIASLNPHSKISAILIHDMVILAEKTKDNVLWMEMAVAVGKISRLIIEQYGMAYAFPLLYPLLDESRKMLVAQVRFPVESTEAYFRQYALFCVVKQAIAIAEFAARSRITDTTYDVLEEIYRFWRDDRELNYKIKSAKKLFQLIILYWHKKVGPTASRQIPQSSELMEPLLLNQTDIDRLSFMAE